MQVPSPILLSISSSLPWSLLNLVDNACKASSEGGLVEVLGRRLEDAYAFQVKDYGVGIPEEELMKCFSSSSFLDRRRSA